MKTNMSMYDITQTLIKHRPTFCAFAQNAIAKDIAQIFCSIIDNKILNIFDVKYRTEYNLYKSLLRCYREYLASNNKSDYDFEDISITLNLYPLNEKDTLINVSYKDNIYGPIFRDIFDDYMYFDNSDKPNLITDIDWDKRRTDWVTTFDMNPMIYNVFDNFSDIGIQDIDFIKLCLEYIPSKEMRVKSFVETILFRKYPPNTKSIYEITKYCKSIFNTLPNESKELIKQYSEAIPVITRETFDKIDYISYDLLQPYYMFSKHK